MGELAAEAEAEHARLARELGLHPFPVADADRAAYHAAAVVASNHLVALLGQVERLGAVAGVPFEAFAPLVRSSVENAFLLGAADAKRYTDRVAALATPKRVDDLNLGLSGDFRDSLFSGSVTEAEPL